MAEAVVDHLEVVEVDEQHRDPPRRGLPGERLVEELDEPLPVRQAGERVVHRLVGEPRPAGSTLRHVLDLGDHVHRGLAGATDQGEGRRHPHRSTVGVQEPLLDPRAGLVAGHQMAEPHLDRGAVVGIGERQRGHAEQLILGPPDHLPEGPVDALQATVDADERQAGGGVLEDGSQRVAGVPELARRPVGVR